MPQFSVIIPTYNRREFLQKAVATVLSQTFGDWELIIVDDGSTDDTAAMVAGYTDARIRCVVQENQGPAAARNYGLRLATAPWAAFLDSDDWWLPEKLQRAQEFIERCPEISVFHTKEVWFRRGKFLPQKRRHQKPDGRVYRQALPLCCISISTAVVRRSVFEQVGVFDESFEACEDYDLWLRITSRYEVRLIPEALTEKDGGRPDELSVRIWGLDRFRIRALVKMLETGELAPEDQSATVAELVKKCRIFAQGARKRGRIREAQDYERLAGRYEL